MQISQSVSVRPNKDGNGVEIVGDITDAQRESMLREYVTARLLGASLTEASIRVGGALVDHAPAPIHANPLPSPKSIPNTIVFSLTGKTPDEVRQFVREHANLGRYNYDALFAAAAHVLGPDSPEARALAAG